MEYKAVQAVNGDTGKPSGSAETLEGIYREAVAGYEAYNGWTARIYRIEEYLLIMGGEEYGRLDAGSKEIFRRYAGELILQELGASEVKGAGTAAEMLTVIAERPGTWTDALRELSEEEQTAIAEEIVKILPEGSGGESVKVVREWVYKFLNGEEDAVLLEMAYSEVHEEIKAFYEGVAVLTEEELDEKAFWELAGLGGAEVLYAYLSTGAGYSSIEAAAETLRELDEERYEKLMRYYRIEEAVRGYIPLLDGDTGAWAASRSGLSDEERERVYERLAYGIRRDGLEGTEEEDRETLVETGVSIAGMVRRDQDAVKGILGELVERQYGQVEDAWKGMIYAQYYEREVQANRLEWVSKLRDSELGDEAKGENLEEQQRKDINTLLAQPKTELYGRLEARIQALAEYVQGDRGFEYGSYRYSSEMPALNNEAAEMNKAAQAYQMRDGQEAAAAAELVQSLKQWKVAIESANESNTAGKTGGLNS
jgi:hypothetical protein